MKILLAPHDVLSSPANPITKIDSGVLRIIKDMEQTLNSAKDPEGVGLAAPQVGISLQIFLAKPAPKERIMVFINPKIVEIDSPSKTFTKKRKVGKRKKEVKKLEGCLSLKDIWGTVLRAPRLKLFYLDEKGKEHTEEFKGFLATIIQHEYDHLQGILFPRRVLEQKGKLYKSTKDEEGEDVFEELDLP